MSTVYGIERRIVDSDGVRIRSREVIGLSETERLTGSKTNARIIGDDVRNYFGDQFDELALGETPDEVGEVTCRLFKDNRCIGEYAVVEGQAAELPAKLAELLAQLGVGQVFGIKPDGTPDPTPKSRWVDDGFTQ